MPFKTHAHFRTDIVVVFCIIFLMVVFEISMRGLQSSISGDLKFLQTIPQFALDLDTAKGTTILFMGNSLVGEGIDRDLIREDLSQNGKGPMWAGKVVPDATGLADWYFIYKNLFLNKRHIPKIMVIGFAWRNALQDGAIPSTRIIHFACRFSDLSELSLFGITGPEKTSEFFLAKASFVFANHAVIRNRFLDLIIPDYRNGTRIVNEASNVPRHGQIKAPASTYVALQRFIKILRNDNVLPVFVAMPVKAPYDINPELQRILSEECILIDCREVSGLKNDMFVDPIHLGQSGRTILSHDLANKMKTEIPFESIGRIPPASTTTKNAALAASH
jgi:hypothetical protein